MIELSEMKESDKGRLVVYRSRGGDKVERGIVSSWNDKFIFVNYEIYPGRYMDSFGCVAAATYPNDLEWAE